MAEGFDLESPPSPASESVVPVSGAFDSSEPAFSLPDFSNGDGAELWSAMSSRDVKLRKALVVSMGRLGDIEGLCEALEDDEVEVVKLAIETLSSLDKNIGPEGARALKRLSTDSDVQVRGAAQAALDALLQRVWPGGKAGLRLELKEKDVDRRRTALHSLRRLGVLLEEEDMASLKEALKDEDMGIRAEAAHAVAELGLSAWGSFSEVRSAAIGTDVFLRRAAVATIGDFLYMADTVEDFGLQDLHIALKDDDGEVRQVAANALSHIRPLPPDIMASLRSMIVNDKDVSVRELVLDCYPDFAHSAGPEDITALTQAMQDSVSTLRKSAEEALTQLGVAPWQGGLAGISKALKSREVWDARAAAAALLTFRGSAALDAELEEVLREALANEDMFVRCVAVGLLGEPRFVDVWPEGLPAMRLAAAGSDPYLRKAAVFSMCSVGAGLDKEDVDIVVQALKEDPDWTVRRDAAHALRALIGVDGVAAALEEVSENEEEHDLVREEAVSSLEALADAPDSAD